MTSLMKRLPGDIFILPYGAWVTSLNYEDTDQDPVLISVPTIAMLLSSRGERIGFVFIYLLEKNTLATIVNNFLTENYT